MNFRSAMETFAEAWVAANTPTALTESVDAHNLLSHHSSFNALSSTYHDLSCSLSNHEKQDLETVTDDGCRLVSHMRPSSPPHNSILMDLKSPPQKPAEPTLSSKPIGKSIPIHCIVTQSGTQQIANQPVELDSYAIIPVTTLFSSLVRTVLIKLGYSCSQAVAANGAIRVSNWKPLTFEQITENPEATVGEILGELTSIATLHITLYSVPEEPRAWTDSTVRNAVLELLREISQSKLSKLCPLSQPMLSNIINNKHTGKIGKEKCQEFGLWYLNYREQSQTEPAMNCGKEKPQDGRLTFHPTIELPLLREWYQACRSPSSRILQMYVDIINQGSVRQQERPKITLSCLKNWWKNERQRTRKNEKLGSDEKKPRKRRKKDENTEKTVEATLNESAEKLIIPSVRSACRTNVHRIESNSAVDIDLLPLNHNIVKNNHRIANSLNIVHNEHSNGCEVLNVDI